jgi:hypothetical protein
MTRTRWTTPAQTYTGDQIREFWTARAQPWESDRRVGFKVYGWTAEEMQALTDDCTAWCAGSEIEGLRG